MWTNHTLHGQSIEHRDVDPSRPGFRVDTSRSKRWENPGHTFSFSFLKVLFLGEHKQDERRVHKEEPKASCNQPPGGCDDDRGWNDHRNKQQGQRLLCQGSSGSWCQFRVRGFTGRHLLLHQRCSSGKRKLSLLSSNSSSQFQSFNGGNWKALELDVRNLASRWKLNLVIDFPFVQAETRPGSNNGHFWHLGIPRRPPETNLDFPLESRLRSGTKAFLESCFRSRDRTVGGFHRIERSTCQRCSGKYLQKQVFFTKLSVLWFVWSQVQWDEILAPIWLWRLGFRICLLLRGGWCSQNNKGGKQSS